MVFKILEFSPRVTAEHSALNKVISFFESYGMVEIKETKVKNSLLSTPIVSYKKIEFELDAA